MVEKMKITDLSETNSVLNQYVLEIRNIGIQDDRLCFRRNIERIGEVMVYEISKAFVCSVKGIQTSLGIAPVDAPDNQLVISIVFRTGLPLHQSFLSYFDYAENAFVSAYRKYKDTPKFNMHTEYIASPYIGGKTLIIMDPILVTGGSIELNYQAMLTKGHPSEIHIASIIASQRAVDHIVSILSEDRTTVWCAVIDSETSEHSYTIPGLGDAGDLALGKKK